MPALTVRLLMGASDGAEFCRLNFAPSERPRVPLTFTVIWMVGRSWVTVMAGSTDARLLAVRLSVTRMLPVLVCACPAPARLCSWVPTPTTGAQLSAAPGHCWL